MLDDILGFFGRTVLGFWDIICWVASAWCGLIELGLGAVGWLLIILSMYLLFTSQWIAGSAIFVVALGFLVGAESFKLVGFWLSDKSYTISPEAFVGDIVGAAISFVIIFGMLFGIWYFFYPVQWLLIAIIALVPISIISSVFRVMKNFLAVIKSKLGGKPKEKK